MSDALEERIALIEKIMHGQINKREVQKEIKRLVEIYGSEVFPKFKFQQKERPWDEEYLEELRNLCMSGAGSSEFLIHLAEVKDSVSASSRRNQKSIVFMITAILLIIVVIVVIKSIR